MFNLICLQSADSFRVFKEHMDAAPPSKSKTAQRFICFARFIATPITIPAELVCKVLRAVASIFILISAHVGILNMRQKNLNDYGFAGWNFVDSLLDLVTSPVTLVAEKVRYFIGIFNPDLVYNTQVINNFEKLLHGFLQP